MSQSRGIHHVRDLTFRQPSPDNASIIGSAVPARAPSKNIPKRKLSPGLIKRSSHQGDRFVPRRSYSGNATARYHVRKLPLDLRNHEKLLRQRETSQDPVVRQPLHNTVFDFQFVINDLSQPPHMLPHLLDSSINPRQYSSIQRVTPRQVSLGAVWNVGGPRIAMHDPWIGVSRCQKKRYTGNTTITPMYTARYFFDKVASPPEQTELIMSRLANAIGIDRAHRQLIIPQIWAKIDPIVTSNPESSQQRLLTSKRPFYMLSTRPFEIEDDFYRTAMAYCYTSELVAFVILDSIILWSTTIRKSVAKLPINSTPNDQITTLAFSSATGRQSLLVVATRCGTLNLWQIGYLRQIFTWRFNTAISCVVFKPTTTISQSAVLPGIDVTVEHLAVGDYCGTVWYYAVEINTFEALSRVTLLARIDAHFARLCTITWSPDEKFLVTGGDDSVCLLFEMKHILPKQQSTSVAQGTSLINRTVRGLQGPQHRLSSIVSYIARIMRSHSRMDCIHSGFNSRTGSLSEVSTTPDHLHSLRMEPSGNSLNFPLRHVRRDASNASTGVHPAANIQASRRIASAQYYTRPQTRDRSVVYLCHGSHLRQFRHDSAVKAVAFAPWQPTLLATGGGMGDRTVYFYHAPSGTCLAKIHMRAQVTGLIWSKTCREILVALGYAEDEHPYRMLIFAWPSCEQVAAIPWNIDEDGQLLPLSQRTERALTTINISNFINPAVDFTGRAKYRSDDECIAIATCSCIMFYRIWKKPQKEIASIPGVLQSRILETLDGIEDQGHEVIR